MVGGVRSEPVHRVEYPAPPPFAVEIFMARPLEVCHIWQFIIRFSRILFKMVEHEHRGIAVELLSEEAEPFYIGDRMAVC